MAQTKVLPESQACPFGFGLRRKTGASADEVVQVRSDEKCLEMIQTGEFGSEGRTDGEDYYGLCWRADGGPARCWERTGSNPKPLATVASHVKGR